MLDTILSIYCLIRSKRVCGARPDLAKMWVKAGVGMSVANDLASRNPEGL
jgi:hypothetical protein